MCYRGINGNLQFLAKGITRIYSVFLQTQLGKCSFKVTWLVLKHAFRMELYSPEVEVLPILVNLRFKEKVHQLFES